MTLKIVNFVLCVALRTGNVDPFALGRLPGIILQNILWHADYFNWLLSCVRVKWALTTETSRNQSVTEN
jgi:hypothetical protein